ncbi:MAG: amidohydrolase family protein [Actinomycetota bacterium]
MEPRLKLFSADDHIIEHPRVWTDRVPAKYRDLAPHIIDEDGSEFWAYEDKRGLTPGLSAVAGKANQHWRPDPLRFTDMIPGCYDPAARAKDMLADGILASVNFPSLPRFGGALFLGFNDKSLAEVCVQAYNDFVIDEWCAGGPPGLFVPSAITPLWDPVLAAKEIRRCATKGLRTVFLPENCVPLGLPSYWEDSWDPIWQACEELDLPICMHIGSSGYVIDPSPETTLPGGVAPSEWGKAHLVRIALMQVGSIASSVNLMFSPVCRKHPGLKFVFSEGGIGWVPNALERADRMWDRHRAHQGLSGMKPSEIFRRNMFVCMIEEPICLKYRHDIGVENILWESDYPHADTVWPHSQESAREIFDEAQVPDDEVAAITHRNAERIFNWTMATPSPVPVSV